MSSDVFFAYPTAWFLVCFVVLGPKEIFFCSPRFFNSYAATVLAGLYPVSGASVRDPGLGLFCLQ